MRGFNLFRTIFLVFLIFGRRRFGFEFRMLCPFFFLERLELFFSRMIWKAPAEPMINAPINTDTKITRIKGHSAVPKRKSTFTGSTLMTAKTATINVKISAAINVHCLFMRYSLHSRRFLALFSRSAPILNKKKIDRKPPKQLFFYSNQKKTARQCGQSIIYSSAGLRFGFFSSRPFQTSHS